MIIVPLATWTGTPSMVTDTISSLMPSHSHRGRRVRRVEVTVEVRAEFLDPAHDRRRAGVAEHADGLAGHVLRQVEQQVEIRFLSFAGEHPLENPRRPRRALATVGTLGAAFMGIELRQPHRNVDD